MTAVLGIDTGGTFTDVVAVDEQTGATTTTKTPSTPADPAEGFLTGVRKVLDLLCRLDLLVVDELRYLPIVFIRRKISPTSLRFR